MAARTLKHCWIPLIPGILLTGQAQAGLDVHGQFRNLLFVPQVDTVSIADLNGLRIDLQSTGGDDRLRFRGSLDVSYTFGDPEAIELGAALTAPEGIPPERLHIDLFRAFIQLKAPESGLELVAGRQRIAWGAGMLLRPTDAFEPTDLFDPFHELSGVDALRLTFPVSDAVYVDAVARLDTASSATQTGLAVGARLPETADLSVSYVHDTIHRREQVGLAARGFGSVNYWLDGAYRYQTRLTDAPYGEARHAVLLELGADYTFPFGKGLNASLEYLFLSNGDQFGGGGYLARAIADYRVLQGQHYVYVQGVAGPLERLNFTLGGLVNAQDGSVVLLPRLTGRPLDTLELELGAQLYFGSNGDEFARDDLGQQREGALLYTLLTTWYF